MLTILTHRMGKDGLCERCGATLYEHRTEKQPEMFVGQPIGKIEAVYGGTSIYRAGEKDSNAECETRKAA